MHFCHILQKCKSLLCPKGLKYVFLYLVFFNVALNIGYNYYENLSFLSMRSLLGLGRHPNNACILPKLKPFEPKILGHTLGAAEKYNCTRKYPLIFYTDLESNLIRNVSLNEYNFTYCCYKSLSRYRNDRKVRMSMSCTLIENNATKTKIPNTLEFIAVFCHHTSSQKLKRVDMFALVHPKLEVEERIKSGLKEKVFVTNYPNSGNIDKMNVVILGLDSISHMNFIRTMPKTHSYIKKNLSGISMNGFTKYGENTFPNLLPIHTGQSVEEGRRECFGKTLRLDTCPFIWKNFSLAGYRTIFIEDAPKMAIFNFEQMRFKNPPTDYYIRPLLIAMKKSMGSHDSTNVQLCYGPRLAFEILLDHLKKAAYTFGKDKNYFYFMWSNVISHDKLNNPKMGDGLLFRTLQWLSSGNYLNNTILVLMSDHGIRYGPIRYTYQGIIEARMPFLYSIFPKWFSEKYTDAIQNFKLNSERLTTPFDLHETLKDLLHLENVDNGKIRERSKDLKASANIPRGISLFLPIPPQRTCEHAQIPEYFCVCGEMEPVSLDGNAEIEITSASVAIVNTINNITSQFPQCSVLELGNIISAQKIVSSYKLNTTKVGPRDHKKYKSSGYIVNIATIPGNGNFEAEIFKNLYENNWSIMHISRTNMYGNQSHCITEDHTKIYCYCKYQ